MSYCLKTTALSIVVALFTGVSIPSNAQSLTFLGDNNTDYPAIRDAQNFTKAGAFVYFTASGPMGFELYKTDGTTSSLELVKDIYPGTFGSHPGNLVAIGDTLYFSASDGVHGQELWKSDGTPAGTALVKDVQPGISSSSISNLTVLGDTLYFIADSRLYKSDGTEAGTVQVSDLYIPPFTVPAPICAAGGKIYFVAVSPTSGQELWVTDGTTAGTALVKDISPGPAYTDFGKMVEHAGSLYFVAEADSPGPRLWRTDGTSNGTIQLGTVTIDNDNELVTDGDRLYFSGTSGAGRELWAYAEGAPPYQVKDIAPGNANSSPLGLRTAENGVFFTADDQTGRGLWYSDGTSEGTVKVKPDSFPPYMAVVGNTAFFSDTTAEHGYELWRSDGTAAGTYLAYEFEPGPADSSPASITAVEGDVYFRVSHGLASFQPYKIDGSNGQLVTFDLTADASAAGFYTDVLPLIHNGKVYFPGWDGAHGLEPWVTDGTPEGTFMLADISPGARDSRPQTFIEFQDNIYFPARDTIGMQLYKTDGTPAGTTVVKRFDVNQVRSLHTDDNFLYFITRHGDDRIWRSNGTDAGTVEIPTGGEQANILGSIADGVLVAYEDPTQDIGLELWKIDSTSDQITFVKDINPGRNNSLGINNSGVSMENGLVVFVANDGTHGSELWVSDGTATGTQMLADMASGAGSGQVVLFNPLHDAATVNGKLYIYSGNTTNPGLWVTDGTPANTQFLAAVDVPGPYSVLYNHFVAVGDKVVFPGTTDAYGRELWITDGTPAGTQLLKDIYPGAPGSGVNELKVVGQHVYFKADNGISGTELWRTDGTAEGTVLVKDILAGPLSSNPENIVVAGKSLVFSADDGIHGREPWYHNTVTRTTAPIADLEPGTASSYPVRLYSLGNDVVFQAYTDATGADIWSANFTPPTSASDWQLFE